MRQYKRTRKLDPAGLSKDELGQLSRLIGSRVSNGTARADVRFSVQTSDMQLSADTLDELLTSDELPPHLRTLTLASEAKEEPPSERVRSVELSFAPTVLECTVSAADSHWVRGTFEEVQTFLRSRRPRTWLLRKYFGTIVVFTVGAFFGFYITAGMYLEWPFQVAMYLAFYAVLFLNYLHVNGRFFSYSDVALHGATPLLTLGRANFVLAAVATFVAVAGYLRDSA